MPQTWSTKQDLDMVLAMLDVVGFKTCDFGKVADTLKALGYETTKEGARQRFPKLRKAFEEAKATGGSGGNDHDNAVQAPPQKTPVKRKADGDGSAKPKSAKKKLNNGNSHPQVAVFKGEEDDENE